MIEDTEARAPETAVLVWSGSDGDDAAASLSELRMLAESSGLEVCHEMRQVIRRPSPSTRIGSGKVEELATVVRGHCAGVVVFDDPLNPAQRRNLERALNTKVIDRSQLILDIFAIRAQTRAGKLQVELAQLEYLLPRLTRQWTHLSRIRGGVGTRGPGETQLESDRRQVRDKISRLKKRLADIDRTRRLNQRERKAVPFQTVALVGYTNVGKSSLMNRLVAADVYVADQLFATLDSTVRRLDMPSGRKVMLSDTVGFVSKLPHELVEAFKGTLEQVVDADLILHVIDASDPALAERKAVVEDILEELGADLQPLVEVYNKCDMPTPTENPRGAIRVSAKTGSGISQLFDAIERNLRDTEEKITVELRADDGRTRAWLYEHTRVVDEQTRDRGLRIVAWVNAKRLGQLGRMLKQNSGTLLGSC